MRRMHKRTQITHRAGSFMSDATQKSTANSAQMKRRAITTKAPTGR